MARSKKTLYRSVRLSKDLSTAITRYGQNPTKAKREALESKIKRFAYRRKYDGEFLTPTRPSAKRRAAK